MFFILQKQLNKTGANPKGDDKQLTIIHPYFPETTLPPSPEIRLRAVKSVATPTVFFDDCAAKISPSGY